MIGLGLGLGLTRGGGIAPSLDLNFLTGTMPTGLSFTRASTATYIGSDGLLKTAAVDVPRFDYDPVTLQPRGLLMEGARTNAILHSNDFTNAVWTKVDATVSAGQVGAAGATSATQLIENTANGFHRLEQAVSYTAGQAYTLSAIARANGGNPVLSLTLNAAGAFSPNPPRVYFDLSTGAIGQQQNFGIGAIRNLGGGRYRCSITATPSSSASGVVQIGTHEADNALTHTGDGASGAFIEAVQFEAGAFQSSTIFTTAAAVTRAADSCVMTGANFSRWFNASEGTIVVEASVINTASNRGVYAISDGTNANEIFHYVTTASNALVTTGGAAQGNILQSAVITANTVYKHALTYKANDLQAAINGTLGTPDTTVSLPTVNRLTLGSRGDSAFDMFGHLRRIPYWPRRLSNSRLQELTA